MAKASERRAARNAAVVRYHALGALLATALFVLYRLRRHADTAGWLLWASLLPTSVTYCACLYLLQTHAAAGGELFQAGLVEYTWDVLWVTLFVQVTACASDWFWVILTIPPAVASYYAWTRVIYPWISRPDTPAGAAEDEASGKRRAKQERAMRRQKGR